VRWRRIDLKRVIAERFGVDFHERYVAKLLQKLKTSHLILAIELKGTCLPRSRVIGLLVLCLASPSLRMRTGGLSSHHVSCLNLDIHERPLETGRAAIHVAEAQQLCRESDKMSTRRCSRR
jgi:hypothetical protein